MKPAKSKQTNPVAPIKTPVPPQVIYPLGKPDSKKNTPVKPMGDKQTKK